MKSNIMEVTFVSVWDGGLHVETNASYNKETGLVYDIETVGGDLVETLDILEREFIRLEDGTELDVCEKDCEYKIIDFVSILKDMMFNEEAIVENEQYPLFDNVLIDLADDYGVKLIESDIVVQSTVMDIDEDGYPYIEKTIRIPKYDCSFILCAYHHQKWDFYIEAFESLKK